MPENHYVLVVHGTFNAPVEGDTKWYQPGGSFCLALESAFRNTPLAGSVWHDAPFGPVFFSWSGGNSHEERMRGARELSALLRRIAAADPQARIHIIAHSHGGNVALAAIGDVVARSESPGTVASGSDTVGADPQRPGTLDHRLGRVVLLGTPFYVKRWARTLTPGFLLLNAMDSLVNVAVVNPFAIALWRAVHRLFTGVWPVWWSPMAWPTWMKVMEVWLVLSTLLASTRNVVRRDVFAYRDHYFAEEKNRKGGPPLTVLQIHAGELDEALLALSADPLLATIVVPLIKDNFANSEISSLSLGEEIPGGVLPFFRFGLFSLASLASRIERRLFAAAIAQQVRGALRGLASGMPSRDYHHARVEVTHVMGSTALYQVETWNASHALLSQLRTAPPPAATSPLARYAFLFDDAALEQQAARGGLWRKVEPGFDGLCHDNAIATEDRDAYRKRLMRMCAALEAKYQEVFGLVELSHSAYYTNKTVIGRVTEFLLR